MANTYASAKSDVEHAELLLNRAVGVYRHLAPDSEATTELTAAHRAVWEWRVNHD